MIRKKIACYLIVLLLAMVCISSIDAQRVRVNRGRSWYRTSHRRGIGYGGYGYGYGGYGYSPGVGMAEVIRARGEAAESVTRASINNEEARSAYFDNRLKYVKTRRELKKIGQEQAQEIAEKKRAARDRYKATHTVKPRSSSLNDSQLDPNSGTINWPDELKTSNYKKERDIVNDAFELRKAYSHKTSSSQQNIDGATKKMMRTLKTRIRDVPSGEYLSARRFLELIQNEVRS